MGYLGATLETCPRAPSAPPLPASVFVAYDAAPVWIVEAKATGAPPIGGSVLGAVAEVHDTVAEPVFLQQLQLDAGVAGECGLSFTDEHRINEELALIDQPGVERVRREGRPADGQVAGGGRLHVADRIGVEAALEPRVGGRDDVQRRGVDGGSATRSWALDLRTCWSP